MPLFMKHCSRKVLKRHLKILDFCQNSRIVLLEHHHCHYSIRDYIKVWERSFQCLTDLIQPLKHLHISTALSMPPGDLSEGPPAKPI